MSQLKLLTDDQLLHRLRCARQHHLDCSDRAIQLDLSSAERQRRVKQRRNAGRAVERLQGEQWRRYEAGKKWLAGLELSPGEYEAAIIELLEALEL